MPLAFQEGPRTDAREILAELFLANTLFVGIACVVLGWVSWQGYKQHRAPFLKLWISSWLCYLLARIVTVFQIGPTGPWVQSDILRVSMSALSQTLYYTHVALLLFGLLQLAGLRRRQPTGRALAVLLAGIAAASFAIAWSTGDPGPWRATLRVGLRCLATAVVFLVCGILLVRHGRRVQRLGAGLAGVALLCGSVVFSLHAYGFSFNTIIDLLSYLGGLEVLVVCSIGLGLVLWMQEDATAAALATNQQLTERTRALLQAQRMESIGHLAGGIAHDFNNVLTVVIGNTDLLLRHADLGDNVRTTLDDTRTAALHAAKMTTQLMSFARSPTSSTRALDINREVRELVTLLRNLAGAQIDVKLALADGPLRVMLMPGHVEQVLINLVVNARDAIAEHGTVTIATRLEASPQGSRVVLTTQDTGKGMPEAVRLRVGELFFTTKGAHGTGMGMASVRSILGDTGGHMEIASVEGSGTTVTVHWPEAGASMAYPATPTEVLVPRPGPATILLAEDDVLVRNVTRRALEGAGYHVLVPETSTAAAALVRQHEGRIDLLLTDVVMPEVSGPQLALAMQSQRPDTVIRFVSGFIDAEHQAQLPCNVPVLSKPFTREELLRFVQLALAKLPTAPRLEQPQ